MHLKSGKGPKKKDLRTRESVQTRGVDTVSEDGDDCYLGDVDNK